jgi:hypothetical protein
MPRAEGIEHDRDAPRPPPGEIPGREQETGMKLRLLFSVALVAVLLCFWLVMSRPMCPEGLTASPGARPGWTCVAAAP